MSKEDCDVLVNVLLLGDMGVGKSSLLARFVADDMTNDPMPTLALDFKMKKISIDGKIIRIQAWDTAGQEQYNSISRKFYRSANGVILVYDVTSVKSFQSIDRWLQVIEKNCPPEIPIILVGNKSDLNDDRIISREIGKQLANNYHLPGFVECSAKTGINIVAPFIITVKKILRTKMPGIIGSSSDISTDLQNGVNRGKKHKCCCT